SEGRRTEAEKAFHRAAMNAEARLDSGLPLRTIAAWREFEIAPTNLPALEMACADAVRHPTLMTPEFFRRASALSNPAAAAIARRWRERWVNEESRRFLWRTGMQYRQRLES